VPPNVRVEQVPQVLPALHVAELAAHAHPLAQRVDEAFFLKQHHGVVGERVLRDVDHRLVLALRADSLAAGGENV